MAEERKVFRAIANFTSLVKESKKAEQGLHDVGDAAEESSKRTQKSMAAMAASAKKSGQEAGKGAADGIRDNISKLERDLKSKRLEVQVSTDEAKRKAADLKNEIDRLEAHLRVEADDLAARTKLDALKDDYRDLEMGLKVDRSQADRDVSALKAQLSREKLALNAQVNANADTAAAEAQLDAAARDRESTIWARMRGGDDVSNFLQRSTLSFGQLIALAATLGTALIPVLAVVTSIAAALAAPLAAAGAGIGAFAASAIGNITRIVTAQEDLETAQKAASSAADAQKAAMAGVASAQAGVVSAVRSREQAELQASRSVADAERALAQTRTTAARSVQSARQGLATAIRSSNESIRSSEQALSSAITTANNSIRSAESNLASAQQAATSAQQALTDAREAARQTLADYDSQLRGAALAEKDAKLAIRSAEQALAETIADPDATQLQIDLARQALAQAKFNYSESKKDRKDLRKQAAEDRKAGVEGDEAVQDAKQNLADANRDVRDAERDLAQTRVDAARDIAAARKAVVQARVEGSRQIAQAEREVQQARTDGAAAIAEAERQVQRAKVDGAAAVAAAQAGVVSANRSLKSAQDAAATASENLASAQGDVAKAMSFLDGPAAGFVDALDRAKRAWDRFLGATEGPVLKTAGIALRLFARIMPQLAPLANAAAGAFGDLLRQVGQATKGGGFKAFLAFFTKTAGPAIRRFGKIGINILVGLFGMFRAFAPLADAMLGGLVRLTARFREWGLAANKSDGVKGFIDYAIANGPKVLAFFGQLLTFIGRWLAALSPIGSVVLSLATGFLRLMNAIPLDVLTAFASALIAGLAIFKSVMLIIRGLAVATAIWNGTLLLNPIGLIVAALVALGAALYLAWQRSATFRKIVMGAWKAIQSAAGVARKIIGKVIGWLVKAFSGVVGWLKKNWRIVAVFAGPIGIAVALITKHWNKVKKVIVAGAQIAMKVIRALGRAGKWLWDNAFKPALTGIGKALSWLWKKVVQPTLGWIGGRIRSVWNNIISPIFDIWKSVLTGDIGGAWTKMKDLAGDAVRGVLNLIKGLPGKLRALGGLMLDAGKWLIKKLWNGLTNVGGFIADIGKDFANTIIDLLNEAIPNTIPIPAAPDIDLPNDPIPKLARGGRATSDTNVIIGDGREPESVLPDSLLLKLMERVAAVAAAIAAGSPAAGRGGTALGSGPSRDARGAGAAFKRVGADVAKTWNSKIRPALNSWDHMTRRRLMPTVNALEKRATTPSLNRIAKRLLRFSNTDLNNWAGDWERTFTKQAPNDFDRFRISVDNGMDRLVKQLGDDTSRIRSMFANMATAMRKTWTNSLRPMFDAFGKFIAKDVAPAFARGVRAIAAAWRKVQGAAKDPVKFVIKTVINDGLIGAFNKIAKYVDIDPMKPVPMPKGFARGGVLPGYTPGRDVHQFRSATGGSLALSGGEAIMRPEWTRAVGGPSAVEAMNRDARTGRMARPQRNRRPHRGNPPHGPRPRSRRFFLGGVFPVPGYSVTNPHGTNYEDSDWAGDIAAPPGANIVAWKDGIVAEAAMNGEDGSYGNKTDINHPDGQWSRYAHQSDILVSGGQQVKAGKHIGEVGDVGNADGYHLHFEVGGGKFPIMPGGGGGPGFQLPGWAQAIVSNSNKWASDLLDGGKRLASPFGGLVQGVLNTLTKPIAEWAVGKLGSGAAGLAGAFGPGAAGVWKSLMSTGWYSKAQAAGVMGNMQSESGFDHTIVQGGSHSVHPETITDMIGWGLVQWTPGAKVAPYLNGDVSVASQIDALTAQLQGKGPAAESKAGAMLKGSKTVREAAVNFLTGYERPADQTQPVKDLRAGQAQAIFDRFAGTHDTGGVLKNNGIAVNKSGKDEYVLPGDAYAMLRRREASLVPAGLGRIGALGPRGAGSGVIVNRTVVNNINYTWTVHNPVAEKTSATTLKNLTSVAQRGLNR